ncbi:MAG: hypothetical protein GY803_32880 [Chloroflexi bacterium]|nr:hypothetical protein [Chloroflexota bacterium]
MPNVKTAISLNPKLLEKVDTAAREMEMPRSHLFVLAVEEFLQRLENQRLLEAINAVYSEPLSEKEETYLQAIQYDYNELLEDEEW